MGQLKRGCGGRGGEEPDDRFRPNLATSQTSQNQPASQPFRVVGHLPLHSLSSSSPTSLPPPLLSASHSASSPTFLLASSSLPHYPSLQLSPYHTNSSLSAFPPSPPSLPLPLRLLFPPTLLPILPQSPYHLLTHPLLSLHCSYLEPPPSSSFSSTSSSSPSHMPLTTSFLFLLPSHNPLIHPFSTPPPVHCTPPFLPLLHSLLPFTSTTALLPFPSPFPSTLPLLISPPSFPSTLPLLPLSLGYSYLPPPPPPLTVPPSSAIHLPSFRSLSAQVRYKHGHHSQTSPNNRVQTR
ncbi:hypothetical protein Pmani_006099 [Petrolisthes manimaculis]|uniref:Uncharacterized protein n=1 Tax=Petrolisthes manimaculis TaxID=1843537 RepID=A0AAE1ULG8_9EUCA|nr:hypothetical protein Pmani_006099 [Petrolisthes manimaculis]